MKRYCYDGKSMAYFFVSCYCRGMYYCCHDVAYCSVYLTQSYLCGYRYADWLSDDDWCCFWSTHRCVAFWLVLPNGHRRGCDQERCSVHGQHLWVCSRRALHFWYRFGALHLWLVLYCW